MLDKFRPVTGPIDCGVIIEVVKGVVDHTTAVFALAVANADIHPGRSSNIQAKSSDPIVGG